MRADQFDVCAEALQGSLHVLTGDTNIRSYSELEHSLLAAPYHFTDAWLACNPLPRGSDPLLANPTFNLTYPAKDQVAARLDYVLLSPGLHPIHANLLGETAVQLGSPNGPLPRIWGALSDHLGVEAWFSYGG